jgi:hypothetical protein
MHSPGHCKSSPTHTKPHLQCCDGGKVMLQAGQHATGTRSSSPERLLAAIDGWWFTGRVWAGLGASLTRQDQGGQVGR